MIDWHTFFFLFAGAICCIFAVAVVLTNDVVRMAFHLIVCLGAVSALFFLAGADFLGALQLMIYVGGTLVLLVFGVMLTARGSMVRMKTDLGQRLLGGLVGLALLVLLLGAAMKVDVWGRPSSQVDGQRASEANVAPTSAPLGLGLMGVRVDQLDRPPESQQPGYLLAFEIVSVHLVVVLIGAAYLARARTRTGARRGAADAPMAARAQSPGGAAGAASCAAGDAAREASQP